MIVRAGATYFALVFGAGFLLALIRIPFLVPRFGVRSAELIETPFMLTVIYFAARFVVRRFALASSTGPAVAAGLLALALLLAAELSLTIVLQDRTVAQYIGGRDPVSGSVYLASLLLFAAMPWLLARRPG